MFSSAVQAFYVIDFEKVIEDLVVDALIRYAGKTRIAFSPTG